MGKAFRYWSFLMILLASVHVNSYEAPSSSQALTIEPSASKSEPYSQFDLLSLLPENVQQYWRLVDAYPILGSLIVALVFLMGAFLVRMFIVSGLIRINTASNGFPGLEVIGHLRKPLFTTIAFFGFALAMRGVQIGWLGDQLINLFLSIIIASWMRSIFKFVGPLLRVIATKNKKYTFVDSQTIPLLDLVVKLAVIMFGSYFLLLVWGINPVGWLASAGIVGIAVGFAAKDTLANVFSGFFILVDSPYKIGDYVNLDSGERGRVSHIGLRSTRLLSRDDIEITLPNAIIANAKIVNESGGPAPTIRIAMSVGVAYGSDVEKVCQILQKIGEDHPDVCEEPEPRVRMRQFGASSLDFDLLCWIRNPEDRGRIRHEILVAIHREFNAQGVEIPYSKTDLYIKSLPDQKSSSDD